ncbi:MAG: hypothetical protein ACI93T_001590, partial [Porticoccaceae bacterium]
LSLFSSRLQPDFTHGFSHWINARREARLKPAIQIIQQDTTG